jgi:hypothetical protein
MLNDVILWDNLSILRPFAGGGHFDQALEKFRRRFHQVGFGFSNHFRIVLVSGAG